MNDADRAAAFPWIEWTKPMPVSVLGNGVKYHVCRPCVCAKGLIGAKIAETPFAFTTEEECLAHLASEHPALRQ